MRQPRNTRRIAALGSVCFVIVAGAFVASGYATPWGKTIANAAFAVTPGTLTYTRGATTTQETESVPPEIEPTAKHVSTPEAVKAVYMSQCVVGTPSFRDSLVELIDTTELNAVVIDIRDYTGGIAFPTDHPLLKEMISDQCGARDMKAFIEKLHAKDIYVIGRVTVFQNPLYTKMHPDQAVQSKKGGTWKDHKGLAFVDVGATEYWKSVVVLAEESYAVGFDEINFDYIRYPSDGNMADANYIKRDGKTKAEMLEDFFKYLNDELPEEIVTSADLFGMVTTNTDDLNIGQVLERALAYFDYVAPMVYPSHYPKGFNGWNDVNAVPYELMKFVMDAAVKRTEATTTPVPSLAHTRIGTSTPALYSKPVYPKTKMRAWLQDFDYPVEYTPAMVEAQIRANAELGLHSYMFWDPGNKYSSLKPVLKPQQELAAFH
jgi:hypothetical protein